VSDRSRSSRARESTLHFLTPPRAARRAPRATTRANDAVARVARAPRRRISRRRATNRAFINQTLRVTVFERCERDGATTTTGPRARAP
jgi:hypothetical protein